MLFLLCLLTCMYWYHMHVWWPWKSEKGVEYSRTGELELGMVVNYYVGTRSWTPASCHNSKCCWLLSHLFSPLKTSFKKKCRHVWVSVFVRMSAVLREARRGRWISWSWGYRAAVSTCSGCWKQLRSSGKTVSALYHWATLPAFGMSFFSKIDIYFHCVAMNGFTRLHAYVPCTQCLL